MAKCQWKWSVSCFLLVLLTHPWVATTQATAEVKKSAIYAVIPGDAKSTVVAAGAIEVPEDVTVTISLVGHNLYDGQQITFTSQKEDRDAHCSLGTYSKSFKLTGVNVLSEGLVAGSIDISLTPLASDDLYYYLCLSANPSDIPWEAGESEGNNTVTLRTDTNSTSSQPGSEEILWAHQGPYFRLRAKKRLLPLWLQIVMIAALLVLSGLFSGLNLGLMSLDPTELIIVQNSGSEAEKKFAKSISPVRKRGNFLLCTLLLGNVLVNSTVTILLDTVGGGVVAVVASTVCIVIFGEIVPQAICSRHGLAVGAKTMWITKIFMVLTFPIAFPLSKLLDVILGDELGQVYSREKLAELIKLGADKQDIKRDELNIIAGALQLTKKSALDVMTTIEDVYMVEYSATLDFETMTAILHTGYTRVPVYEENRLNIVALLNVKDLAFVDPDDKIPLKTVCKFYNHPITFVFEDTSLDQLLEEFKKGQSHMAFVQRVVEHEKQDPYYDVMGIVTLEDIIEEIIQCEILDETDIITDNQTKRRRHNIRRKDFSVFNQPTPEDNRTNMSPQLMLATFQYLQTTVEPFKEEHISGSILKRLLKQDICKQLKYNEKSIDSLLYIATKPADYFIIILQGKCMVEIGKDQLKFEAGPFFSFGAEALMMKAVRRESLNDTQHQTPPLIKRQSMPTTTVTANKDPTTSSSVSNLNDLVYKKGNVYLPDFTLKALTDLQFIKVKRHQYIAAQRATLMERQPKSPRESTPYLEEDPFSTEWKKANLSHLCDDEGTTLLTPAYKQHQRNYSSGNIDGFHKSDNMKLAPLIGTRTSHHDEGPLRTVIYPRSNGTPSPLVDPEKVQLLIPPSRTSGKEDRTSSHSLSHQV